MSTAWGLPLPGGYVPLRQGRAIAAVRADAAESVHAALSKGTLFDVAAEHPAQRTLMGRGPAHAIPLTGDVRVVVRHNRHGGLLARFTGDRFRAPTRGPYELEASERLRRGGIATPQVVAVVRYPAGPGLERADVATEEIPGAMDLVDVLTERQDLVTAATMATAALLAALSRAHVHHADLNLKNVLLDAEMRAYVLDVDRVTFDVADAGARNLARFERSARKWRDRWGAPITEAWIASVRDAVAAATRTP